MKTLFVSIVLAASLYMGLGQTSTGEQQIIKYVAEEFQVQQSDVTLASPNIVTVQLTGDTETGLAAFRSCGTDCTEVQIEFTSTTLDFIVEDEVSGF